LIVGRGAGLGVISVFIACFSFIATMLALRQNMALMEQNMCVITDPIRIRTLIAAPPTVECGLHIMAVPGWRR